MDFKQEYSTEIIFICGLYKTGTSLLATQIENLGYYNPASESNRFEKGHGILDNYYLTKECVNVRRINQNIINKKSNRFRLIENEINSDIIDYLTSIKKSLVLKDPLFVFTLNVWLYNISILGLKPKVYFTFRNERELLRSWLHAYHTKGLYKDEKSIIIQMQKKQLFQIDNCVWNNVPFNTYTYSSNYQNYE